MRLQPYMRLYKQDLNDCVKDVGKSTDPVKCSAPCSATCWELSCALTLFEKGWLTVLCFLFICNSLVIFFYTGVQMWAKLKY